MKLTILSSELTTALSFVGRAVASRPTLPVLSHVLVRADADTGTLYISGTDLEIRVDTSTPANVLESGALTVPARLFTDFVNSLSVDGTVQLTSTESNPDHLLLEQGKVEATLRGISADEFPMPPSVVENGERVATFEPEDLRARLDQVVGSAATDESRPILTGVFIERKAGSLSLVSADGFRMSLRVDDVDVDVDESEDWTAVVPAKALAELVRALKDEKENVSLWQSGNSSVAFRLSRLTLTTQLLTGNYINYRQIIPANHVTSAIVNLEELEKALKTALVFNPEKKAPFSVKFSFVVSDALDHTGLLRLHAEGVDLGDCDSELNVQIEEGESMDVALNAQFTLYALGAVDTALVKFELNGSTRPVVLKPVGKNDVDGQYTHVIMPMHVRS